ncbi:hypothetical protein TNCV_4027391 [Trichonephila clavipes]|nr:hypothetical protein TNCV_4027391 [Trichonephila clavipes]
MLAPLLIELSLPLEGTPHSLKNVDLESDSTSNFTLFKIVGNGSESRKLAELKPRNVEYRFCTWEILLPWHKRNRFPQCIITGDDKWVHYDNSKKIYHGNYVVMLQQPNIH